MRRNKLYTFFVALLFATIIAVIAFNLIKGTSLIERIGPNISPLSVSRDIVHASFAKMESAAPREEKVKWYVVGPHNSGTNFVYKQFEKNCPKIGVFEARWVGVPNDPGDDAAIEELYGAKKGEAYNNWALASSKAQD